MRILVIVSWIILTFAVLWPKRASAQSEGSCESIFQYGIYDAYSLTRSNYSLDAFHNAMCNGTVKESSGVNSSGGGGTVTVGIPGVVDIGLGGNFQKSRQFQEYYKQTFCQSGARIMIDDARLANFANVVSPTMTDAYKACVSAKARGLSVVVQRTTADVVTFAVTFDQPNSTAKFNAVYVEPPAAATCRTPNLQPNTPLDGGTRSVTCSRQSGSLSEFTIAIHTTAGVFTYLMPSKPSPTMNAPTPFGAVVSYAGTVEPAGWKFCNGQFLDIGDYPELFKVIGYAMGGSAATRKFAVPNLNGMFVRGLGEKDRVIGSTQDWRTGLPRAGWAMSTAGGHNHHMGVSIDSPDDENTVHEQTDKSPNELDIRNPRSLPTDGAHTHVITGGDDETRPVNVALNYLIYTGIRR